MNSNSIVDLLLQYGESLTLKEKADKEEFDKMYEENQKHLQEIEEEELEHQYQEYLQDLEREIEQTELEMFDTDYDVPIMDNRLMPMQYVNHKIESDQRNTIRVQDKKFIRVPNDVKKTN